MIRFITAIAAAALLMGASFAGTDLKLAPFSAINAHAGAQVTLHYGPVQRVTVITGDLKVAKIQVTGGSTLDISACEGFCWGSHTLKLDIVSPRIDSIVAHSGGGVAAEGDFPKLPKLAVTAHSGGAVNAGAIAADQVDVTAHSGGSARVKALQTLNAQAHSGGSITYSGHPAHVNSQTNSGGSISGE
jgi:hypothetical protein